MSTKSNLIEKVLVDLSMEFNTVQLKMISDSLLKALDGYTLEPASEEYSLATIDNYNDELLKKFFVKKTLSGISEGSIKQYIRQTRILLDSLNKRAVDVTAEDVELFLMSYKIRHNSSNTYVANMKNWLSAFFDYLENEDLIRRNPVKKLPRVVTDTIPEPIFTKTEEEKLFMACNNTRDRAILEFCLATGCRVSEVCNVKISDLDISTNAIRIIGKGHKLRTVFTTERALVYVNKYLGERNHESEYIFTGLKKPHGKLHASGVEALMKNIGKRAGVAGVHPHRFRATFCTRMIDRGVPLHVVQKLMGHSSIETTMRYYRGSGNIKAEYEKYST